MPTILVTATSLWFFLARADRAMRQGGRVVQLPCPEVDGEISVEAALAARRSVRDYSDEPLGLAQLAQLLWAAQGLTHSGQRRTAPSAGALYPIELYLVAGAVEGLPAGIYRYRIKTHDLLELKPGDGRAALARQQGEDCVRRAPAVIVVAAAVERTAVKYGQRAERYVQMEVGSVAQNIHLQAAALDLGTVLIGAFNDNGVHRALGLPGDERPFAIMPVGNPH